MTIFHFRLYWIIVKIKAWEAVIQRSIKTIFLLLKRRWKMTFFFFKIRCVIEMCSRGKQYTGIHSIKKYSETFALLQTGMWWRNLFLKTSWHHGLRRIYPSCFAGPEEQVNSCAMRTCRYVISSRDFTLTQPFQGSVGMPDILKGWNTASPI